MRLGSKRRHTDVEILVKRGDSGKGSALTVLQVIETQLCGSSPGVGTVQE